MSKKSLIIGISFLLLLLLAGTAGSSETEPVYAGWTVGDLWDGYGTILRSTDSGETWVRQGGADQFANVHFSGVFAVDPYTAWVVGSEDDGYATIYHTTNGGETWERKGSSDPASADYIPVAELQKIHAVGDDVWTVGMDTILHTSDGGATWTNQFPAGYENIALQGVYVLDSKTVWATGGPDEDDQAVILKTTNAGRTWTRQTGGDVAAAEYCLGISAADANTAWTVGRPYIVLKTTDGGTTWMRDTYFSDNPSYQYDINEVYAVSTSTVWVASDFSIYRTTDGGHSWDIFFNDDLAFLGISAVNAQQAWGSHVGRSGYIVHTTDGGDTWTKIDQLNGEPLRGLWNISFATQPIYPHYLIISMIEDVEMLVDDGILNKGQGNAIIVKLEKALDRLDDDRQGRNRGAAKKCCRRSK